MHEIMWKKSLKIELLLLVLTVSPTLSAPVGDSEAIGFVKKPDNDREPRWSFNYAPGQIHIASVSGGDYKIGHDSSINIGESFSQLPSPGPKGSTTMSVSTTTVGYTTMGGSTTTTTTTSVETTLKPDPEGVAQYKVCKPGPFILNADCFCGKTNEKGKFCNKGFKCNDPNKDEKVRCINPDKENDHPCTFDDNLLVQDTIDGGKGSPFDTNSMFRWPGNEVPYYYSDEVIASKGGDKQLIELAMSIIEEKTCFKFVNGRKDELENKKSLEISIKDQTCKPCSGSVSSVPFKKRLKLTLSTHITYEAGDDCGNQGLVTHELMHALGVGHTQRRSDRDEFIQVKFENFGGSTSQVIKEQYRKCGSDCKTFESIPYDCGSIMHYGTHYDGRQVIVPKDEKCKSILKNQNRLYLDPNATAEDYELLNIIGKCAGDCYYDKDTKGGDIQYCGSLAYLEEIRKCMGKKNCTSIPNKKGSTCDASNWPDLRRGLVCGNCKALIDKMNFKYKTCDEYCKRIGRRCSGAWEDDDDSCQVESKETCSTEFLDTSDAICECGALIDACTGPPPAITSGTWECDSDLNTCELICDPGYAPALHNIECVNGQWDLTSSHTCTLSLYLLAGGLGATKNVELYNPTLGSPCESPPPQLTERWRRHTSFIHNSIVYLCSGQDHSDTCISLNTQTASSWTTHKLSLKIGYGLSSVVLGDKVLFIGGRDDVTSTYVTTLPLSSNPTLTQVPNLSYKGHGQCVAKLNATSFIISGGSQRTVDGKQILSTVLLYDFETKKVIQLSSLTPARRDHSCIIEEQEGKMWLIVTGGVSVGDDNHEKTMSTTQRLDIEANTWEDLGDLKEARYGHTMIISERKLVMVLGGYNDKQEKAVSGVEVLENKKWQNSGQSLKTERDNFGRALKVSADLFNCQIDS